MINRVDNEIVTVTFHSIPNYWFTYYFKGFVDNKNCKVKINLKEEYKEFFFTNRTVLSFSYKGIVKSVVIDLDDPCGRHLNYWDQFDLIFLSQKLINTNYECDENYIALLPHFPIRSFEIIRFAFNKIGIQYFLKICIEVYRISKLKPLSLFRSLNSRVNSKEIFYYRSLWKKELKINKIGAIFLDIFKTNGFSVLGGLFRRDSYVSGDDQIDKYIIKKRLSNKTYIKYLRKSLFAFNTPSVRGACSWRFAEYVALDKVIINTTFAVYVPEEIKTLNIDYESIEDFQLKLTELIVGFDIKDLHNYSNKVFFQENMLPSKQIDFILNKFKKIC